MSAIRTLAPALSGLIGKDLSATVHDAAAVIGMAARVRACRAAGTPTPFTKAEVTFLRDYTADPLEAIKAAEYELQGLSVHARTLELSSAPGQRLDLPRIKPGQTGTVGTPLAITLAKDATPEVKARTVLMREEHRDGAKALAMLGMLQALRDCDAANRAAGIAFAAVASVKGKLAPKRLESHAAALLTADPGQVAALLKAMGLPAEAVGAIVALMVAKAKPAAEVIPALLPAPV